MTDWEHQPTSGPAPYIGAGVMCAVAALSLIVTDTLDPMGFVVLAVLAVAALAALVVWLRLRGGNGRS